METAATATHRVRTTVTGVVLSLIGIAVPVGAGAATTQTPQAKAAAAVDAKMDPAGFYGADAEMTTLIETAVARYASTGLTLPDVRIYIHETREGCSGADGLFTHQHPIDRIDVCTRLQATVLHELAHAWEHHNVSDETRQDFLDHTGLDAWQGYAEWADRGIERAAQVIAWGLMDIQITNTERFAEQLDLFELLTGTPSPRI